MMGARVTAAVLFSIVGLAACGGGVETGAGGSTTTTTSSSAGGSGGGGTVAGSDCATNADCNGGTCAELLPGGYKICLTPPPEATACNMGGPVMDQCCTSLDCQGGGKCYLSSNIPSCGGAPVPDYNYCAGDACKVDSDCQGAGVPQICAPAGAFGAPGRACVNAYCKTDADCMAGGVCAPVLQQCCGLPSGLACVYPGGCRKDSECGNSGDSHCEIDPMTHDGTCMKGPAVCPA